ncbi:MAG: histidine triad nucleotide-binding protein [Candidatus Kapabacteria bacterium]|nr:histidine triad nucleotide-binding protein [Candidatus Kapabacteria bacterium]MDW8012740.1 histidine triad nucleotide-binding protein [Bacteroidota bacterium]
MSETVFARIIRREVPAQIEYEDDEVLAFRDINPQAPVHILIIPKKPLPTLNEATADDVPLLGRLLWVARQLAERHGIAESGYRLVLNCNRDAGQTVFHLHLHLLGGRQFQWPPG